MAITTRVIVPLLMLLTIISCNNREDSSPYEQLLSRPPYSVLTDSIHENSSNADLYYRRGMLLFKNNNNLPALADFNKAWSLNKKEQYAMGASNILLETKPDSAIIFLQNALSVLPGSVALHVNLIQALAGAQKTDEALALCDSVLSRDPGQVGILMMKSDLLAQKDDSVGSIKLLEQARSFAPANEDICYDLAFKYAQSKNPKALALCDSLIKTDSVEKKAEPYYFRGTYYANMNNKSKAMESFDKAIERDYTFLDAYMAKGEIFFDQKKYPEAGKVFQLALKISNTYADAYYWLGKCQEAMGQKDEAKLNYQRAYGLDKTLTEARDAAARL